MDKKGTDSSIDLIQADGKGSLADRFEILMKGRTIRQAAEDWGIGPSTLNAYLKKGSVPNLNLAQHIADMEKVTIQWLSTGDDEPVMMDSRASYLTSSLDSEFALIPGYRIQVSAGHGSLNPDQLEPTRHLAFRRKWLKYRGFNEKDLAIVWAKGDSMEPTIHNNDTLVVHLGRNKPSDGHIYIFRNGDELFVKRYQSMLGTWRLISDNSFYSPLDIPKEDQHQFEVVGQVVHIAKDIGD
ncbi:LexA family transcriptional regulator [Vibrio sp. ER1A]|uniref:LexA family transcriptional regulator n=1 Tax=Vibrio sp. ER1A TaxID=1517681 RepID=UPI0004DCFF74|nr:XRE family transcriptional regulator [Vibrio sp. ER1A]KFA96219.1 transcriptional regulator [Vibrio sp. ER1A]